MTTESDTTRRVQIAVPSLGDEEWHALREPLASGWLTQGPKVAEFEAAFAERHRVGRALAVTSCTTGLHLALAALGIGPGDEVIVPAFTWVATANVVAYCGATPVFADVDRETFNVTPQSVQAVLSDRTAAVVAVHLFGLCADVEGIRAVLPDGVRIIEDAACAAGAEDRSQPAGGLGDVAAFSFHPRKSITTGEGGMVTTNDDALADRIEVLRNHGASVSEEVRHRGPRPYLLPDYDVLGYNYRMTDLQGAVGLVQLSKLDRFIAEREYWAQWYRDALDRLAWLRTPTPPSDGHHAWQAYVCYVDLAQAPAPRNELMERLQSWGVATRPGTHAVHMLGYYRERLKLQDDDFPAARDCDRHSMAIPLHNRMTREDYEHVVAALRRL